ncbi:MAG: transglutaminase-like cysteine peptidase [Hyphomicrobiales bacterium]
MKYLFRVIVMLAVYYAASSPVAAHSGAGNPTAAPAIVRMVEGPRVMAPIAHIVFCMSYKSECRRGVSIGWTAMNPTRWRDLETMNTRINRSIDPVSDASNSGKIDVWTIGEKRGDCEEYAIAKRAALITRGWLPASVLLAVVLDKRAQGHAVVVVRTDQGDFVLDNLTAKIRAWNKTGYTWVKQQSSGDPRIWVRIAKALAPGSKLLF